MELLNLQKFIKELSVAAKLHFEWSAVSLDKRNLRAMPRHDLERIDAVLSIDSHKNCEFGRWFKVNRQSFDNLDEFRTHQLKRDHYQMHEAARIYYSNPEKNAIYFSRLVSKQEEVVDHITHFKSLSNCLLKDFFMS